jgi:DNA repair exonuclease SbcCD ATPase subunit
MAFIDSSAAYSIMLAFAEEMRAAKDDENATDGVRDDLMKNIAAKYKSIQDEIQSLSNRRTALNQEMEASKRDLAHATAIASAESQRIKNFNNALEVVKPTKADLQTLKQLQELIMKMKDGNKFDPSKLTPAELKKFAGAESPLSRLTTNLEAYFEKSEAINREYKEAAAQISEKYKKETAFEKSSE